MNNKHTFFSFFSTPLSVLSIATIGTSLFSLNTYSDSLLEVYELAANNDHEYRANIANYNADKEAINIGRSALLPQIAGSAGYSEANATTSSPNTSLDGKSDTDTKAYSVELQQALINFNALNTYRSNKLQTSAAEIQLAADQQSLIIRSAEAYFDVLRAIDQLRTSQAEEKALSTQLEQTRQRYEVGLISINDVYEAQAAYDSTVASRLSAQVNVGTTLESLTILTGKNHTSIAPLKNTFSAVYPSPNDKQAWIDAANKNNLLLQVDKINADVSSYDAKAIKANRYPTLTGSISYGNRDSDVSDNGTGSVNRSDDTDTTRFSLDLNIPIYSGGNLTARQRQAAQQQIASKETFLFSRRKTIQETRSLFLTVSTDIAQIKARKQAIVSNESALEATQAGYDAGTRDIVDVVNAQRNLFQAQRDYFNALYNYIISTLNLKRVAGTLNVNDLEQLEQSLKESEEVIYQIF
ncbi:MAG: outer membrane protein [Cellvibrionaceae bacterium]|jgi:outer membrane protein